MGHFLRGPAETHVGLVLAPALSALRQAYVAGKQRRHALLFSLLLRAYISEQIWEKPFGRAPGIHPKHGHLFKAAEKESDARNPRGSNRVFEKRAPPFAIQFPSDPAFRLSIGFKCSTITVITVAQTDQQAIYFSRFRRYQ